MKFLVLTLLVAAAFASPAHRFVQPGAAGPAPVIMPEGEPISIGPGIVHPEIGGGPAFVDDFEPIAIGPAIINEPIPQTKPVVQIIININEQGQVVGSPVVVKPEPEPVVVVDEAADPVIVVDAPPAVIGNPVIPAPVITLPDDLN
ncbi:PREDICTED: uncharacterized protein LOC106124088 [Papilio xuthus]|uniref:Uncharacterized protein LOC106124088 n=1 Tax=Papilio xuthus TaxID=66420 RepID=A0A194PNZ3_PAPXU|nr:PREDICTED: uncharacterized protein LOC106124088 [Papilio xuthus]KPI95151.1 hypothetical protein RR46_12155 [Papilio xuthus]